MEWKLFANLAERAGEKQVTVEREVRTVGEALDALLGRYPELREVVCEDGELADHVNLLVNGEEIRRAEGLETSLESGDELALFPPVSGG